MSEEKRFHDLVIRIAMKHDREKLMKDGYSSKEIDKADKHYWECEGQNQRMQRELYGIFHNGETN